MSTRTRPLHSLWCSIGDSLAESDRRVNNRDEKKFGTFKNLCSDCPFWRDNEQMKNPDPQTNPPQELNTSGDRRYLPGCAEFAIVIVIVAGIVIVILALLGPAIGNVFTSIMVGI